MGCKNVDQIKKVMREVEKYIAIAKNATPGPWEILQENNGWLNGIDGPSGYGWVLTAEEHLEESCSDYGDKNIWCDCEIKVKEEDLKLIVSAPEMARLLEEMYRLLKCLISE